MTIEITRPEVEAIINQRLQSGAFKDAQDVILHALRSSGAETTRVPDAVAKACEQLKTFGKKHGLSLGGMSLRELRHEARP